MTLLRVSGYQYIFFCVNKTQNKINSCYKPDLECEDLFASLDHVLDVIFYPGGLRRVSRPLDQATGEARQDQLSSGNYESHKIELQ